MNKEQWYILKTLRIITFVLIVFMTGGFIGSFLQANADLNFMSEMFVNNVNTDNVITDGNNLYQIISFNNSFNETKYIEILYKNSTYTYSGGK